MLGIWVGVRQGGDHCQLQLCVFDPGQHLGRSWNGKIRVSDDSAANAVLLQVLLDLQEAVDFPVLLVFGDESSLTRLGTVGGKQLFFGPGRSGDGGPSADVDGAL